MSEAPNQPTIRDGVRLWLRPPRAHGEVIDDRTVSFLELFYDLVFVVLIAQIAHTLAGDVSWSGLLDFTVLFSLVWIAWLNGTLYHELHGGEDGRSRMYIFAQMALLALLSVYAGHAFEEPADGRGFAIVYAILISLLAWQWFDVRRVDDPEWRSGSTRYLLGLAPVILLSLVSAAVDAELRRTIWIAIVVLWLGSVIINSFSGDEATDDALRVTESMSERFGLFTIIVLGEVVVGVVEGLGETERSARTIVTGLLALGIGYGIWWNYFDFVGRRLPRSGVRSRMTWLVTHFPLVLAIAATGAGMVSLIEHAGDAQTPANTAWLLAGGTAAVAASIAILVSTLPPNPAHRKVPFSLAASGVVAIVAGATQPAPWVLALVLYAAFSAVWMESFIRHARQGTFITED